MGYLRLEGAGVLYFCYAYLVLQRRGARRMLCTADGGIRARKGGRRN